MSFDWDSRKATINEKKHGISFELAMTVFDDPFALIAEDEKHSASECREWIIGLSDQGVLVVIYTKRLERAQVRIISARRANKKEKELYEEYKKLPI